MLKIRTHSLITMNSNLKDEYTNLSIKIINYSLTTVNANFKKNMLANFKYN